MHTIRLREPWQSQWLDATRLEPGNCLARYDRKFHRPTGIDGEAVVLCITPATSEGDDQNLRQLSASLNDCPLALENSSAGQSSALVSDLLQPFNRLVLQAEVDRSGPASAGPPPLEIIAQVSLQIG